MKKIVLIGDIINSKNISQRAKIQSQLNSTFKKINIDKLLLSPYTITLGDEFQAVYNKADSVFNHIWLISLAIYPLKIRFSIGVGDITTKINRKQAIGMDGPAFYNARNGLNELKESGFIFMINSDELASKEIIKQSLFLISHLTSGWKKSRLDILVLLNENFSIGEIAGKLKITDKAVYKNIDAGALKIIIDLIKEITINLNQSLK
ncbi:MAG: SatD family protein [Ignavibacteriaceae bacterium]